MDFVSHLKKYSTYLLVCFDSINIFDVCVHLPKNVNNIYVYPREINTRLYLQKRHPIHPKNELYSAQIARRDNNPSFFKNRPQLNKSNDRWNPKPPSHPP